MAGVSEIVDAGRREMLDRINRGDYAYTKDGAPALDDDGNHMRKKVGLHHLTIATGVMFDKEQRKRWRRKGLKVSRLVMRWIRIEQLTTSSCANVSRLPSGLSTSTPIVTLDESLSVTLSFERTISAR